MLGPMFASDNRFIVLPHHPCRAFFFHANLVNITAVDGRFPSIVHPPCRHFFHFTGGSSFVNPSAGFPFYKRLKSLRVRRHRALSVPFISDRGLGGGQPGERHPVRGTAYIVQSGHVANFNRSLFAAGFAARPNFTPVSTSLPTPSRSSTANGLSGRIFVSV